MILTIALIAVTAIVSYKGFQDSSFLQQYSFSIQRVREYREYYRYVTSGFLHVSWIHLAINMFVLFAFGSGLEQAFGMVPFLIVYLGSLVGVTPWPCSFISIATAILLSGHQVL